MTEIERRASSVGRPGEMEMIEEMVGSNLSCGSSEQMMSGLSGRFWLMSEVAKRKM